MLFIGVVLIAPIAAQTISPADITKGQDLLRKQQHWETRCSLRGCILSVDILRAAYISTPDPNDVNQYISVAVATDRSPQKTNFLMFEVDPHADKNAGIVIALAKTVPQGNSFKIEFDDTIPFPIDRCDNTTCKTILPGGLTKDGIDLLAKMQQHTHLFLLYTRDDQTYRTEVNLDLFNEAYQEMLGKEFKAASAVPNHH